MVTLDELMHEWLLEQPDMSPERLAALRDLHRRISDWSSWDWLDETNDTCMPHSAEDMLRVLQAAAEAVRSGNVKAVLVAVLQHDGECISSTTGLATRVERLGMLARAMHLEQ